jgi:hypothetical protein
LHYNPPAMKVSRRTTGLVLLGCLALALRVCLVLAVSRESTRPLAFEHGRIAENLLAGRGFSIAFLGTDGPTSQQAPFYPVLLAAAYATFGVAKPAAILAVQLFQCVVGTGLVLAVVWLAWSLFAERPVVGWIAGLGAALYPPHVYMVTHLQVVVWATMLLTLLLAVAVSPRWSGRWSGAALIGLLAGALLLVEPILSLSLPIVGLAFWLSERQCSRHTPCAALDGTRRSRAALALGRLVLMAGVTVLVIAPWIVRNWRVHGEFVFIKSTFGYAFWQGNNPASWGTDKIPKASALQALRNHDGTLAGIDQAMWEARHETIYIDDLLLKPGGYRPFLGLSEPQRSRLLGRQAWEFIRRNPAAYGKLCLMRLRYFLLFDETNPKAASRIYRLATVAWLVLSGVGLLATLGRWRQLWPTYAIFALVTLFHTLVITSVRFRLPIEPLGMVWAAAGIGPMVQRWTFRPSIKASPPGREPDNRFGPQHALQGPHRRGKVAGTLQDGLAIRPTVDCHQQGPLPSGNTETGDESRG